MIGRAIIVCVMLLFAASCGPPKNKASYRTVPNAPDLAHGKSAIRGKVHWKGEPITGITVMLCDHVTSSMIPVPSPYGGGFNCSEQAERVTTDETGTYVFSNLEPSYRDYKTETTNLATPDSNAPVSNFKNTNSFRSNTANTDTRSYIPVAVVEGEPHLYFYWESGLGTSALTMADTIYPYADTTYEVEPIVIRKKDLRLTSPTNGEKIMERRPALIWEDYPEAKSYSVFLYGNSVDNRNGKFDLDSSKPGAAPTSELPNGKYRWSVWAKDKNFERFAESSDGTFEVVDQLPQPSRKRK